MTGTTSVLIWHGKDADIAIIIISCFAALLFNVCSVHRLIIMGVFNKFINLNLHRTNTFHAEAENATSPKAAILTAVEIFSWSFLSTLLEVLANIIA